MLGWHRRTGGYASVASECGAPCIHGETMATLVPGASPPVSIRLPRPLLDFVDQQAIASFKSRNAYIRDLIAREYEAAKRGAQ